ncbi:Hypothetical protein BCO_0007001 (plasmid) [Borrelia coriaceae ATCC 43381]|uniref:Uncharacterized protein n=1 Tax=Borrelia coriaceae ATCC 43381 TaxID=1408429 RepID=W5SXI5_9SPIR|nr:Hypothetical protein BCO_0007001 [Borrelia coriaceae ATCC 43381]
MKDIIEKIKKTVKYIKTNTQEDKKEIRNNIFSILIEQLRNKMSIEILIPILKDYLDKQNKLEYSKVLSNHYYYELLKSMEDNKDYVKVGEFEKITI